VDAMSCLLGMVIIMAALIKANQLVQKPNAWWDGLFVILGLGSETRTQRMREDMEERDSGRTDGLLARARRVWDITSSALRVAVMTLALLLLLCVAVFFAWDLLKNMFADRNADQGDWNSILRFIFSYGGMPWIKADAFGITELAMLLGVAALLATVLAPTFMAIRHALGDRGQGLQESDEVSSTFQHWQHQRRAETMRMASEFMVFMAAGLILMRGMFFFNEY
jgi:hypothetical protein